MRAATTGVVPCHQGLHCASAWQVAALTRASEGAPDLPPESRAHAPSGAAVHHVRGAARRLPLCYRPPGAVLLPTHQPVSVAAQCWHNYQPELAAMLKRHLQQRAMQDVVRVPAIPALCCYHRQIAEQSVASCARRGD